MFLAKALRRYQSYNIRQRQIVAQVIPFQLEIYQAPVRVGEVKIDTSVFPEGEYRIFIQRVSEARGTC